MREGGREEGKRENGRDVGSRDGREEEEKGREEKGKYRPHGHFKKSAPVPVLTSVTPTQWRI